ncbi:hypothetical protein GQ457_11G031180 [Hibiscus cannabinus]
MDSRREISKCDCGVDADPRTSWSNANLGRSFFCYSKYGVGRNCNFFLWCDLEIGNRERIVLVGLSKKIRKMEEGRKKECFGMLVWLCIDDIMVFYVVLIRILDFDLRTFKKFLWIYGN